MTNVNDMINVATEAATFSEQYRDRGDEIASFMEQLWHERGLLTLTNPQARDWRYRTYQDLVLDLSIDGPRRVPIWTPEHIGDMERRQCFYNAHVLATDPRNEFTYYEGFAQTRLLVVKHAWVVDRSGTIIDPTWSSLDEEEATYFGVPFSDTFVLRHSLKTGYTSILDGDWRLDFAALRKGFVTDENGVVINMEGLE